MTSDAWRRVISSALAAARDGTVPYFYRTEDGSEIDLVLERGGRVEVAVEIKRSTAPEVSKGFRLACEALRPRSAFVVHGDFGEWPMKHGVVAISLTPLMKRLARTRQAPPASSRIGSDAIPHAGHTVLLLAAPPDPPRAARGRNRDRPLKAT